MIKFILVLKVCSALDGTCVPERNIGIYDNWHQCARQGTVETLILLDSIGEELVNKNKLYIAFSCQTSNNI